MASFPTVNKAPGVYIQEVTLPGPIAGVSTSIAAIVGPAQMGPLLTPTTLTNIKQFWEIFGTYIETPYRVYAAHAVNGFFAEGGQQCYFVRVGNGKAASLNLLDQANLVVAANPQQSTLVVTAQQEGVGGDSITAEVDSASIASTTAVNPSATPAAASAQLPLATPKSTAAGNLSITVTNAADAAGFSSGDQVNINDGTHSENATVASVAGAVITFAAPLVNSYTSGAILKRDRITVTKATDAAGFYPGDLVTITSGATTENATIASLSGATIVFQAPLTNTYSSGSITLANLTPGTMTIRLASTTGLEPGSSISISDGTNTDYDVVRLVNSVNNVITLTNGLTSPYTMGSGAATLKVTSMEFTLKIVAKSPYPTTGSETFAKLAMDPRHSRYFGSIVSSAFIDLALADPPLPIDDSDGGCDTADSFYKAWSREIATLHIAPEDVISDNGAEIYSFLRIRGIENLLIMGVHTNMCILNRSFAIKQMTKWGIHCVLVRDLTDSMYNPNDRPRVSHGEGTELVIEHIEKYWAPTVLSTELAEALREGK
jgi:hypothetical protein